MFKLSRLNLLQCLTSEKNQIKRIFDLNIIQEGIDTLKIFLKIKINKNIIIYIIIVL
jgi:hypothetical protein